MNAKEIVDRVNEMLYEGLYSYPEMKREMDGAIRQINKTLNAAFPKMTQIFANDDWEAESFTTYFTVTLDSGESYTFPEGYVEDVVIPYVTMRMFRREGEFGNEFIIARQEVEEGLSIMFRDYFDKVPETYKDMTSGTIEITDDTAVYGGTPPSGWYRTSGNPLDQTVDYIEDPASISAPVIYGVPVYPIHVDQLGVIPNLRAGVRAVDSIDGDVSVYVNQDNIDVTTTGLYTITYRASDEKGNQTIKTATVEVSDVTAPTFVNLPAEPIHADLMGDMPNLLGLVSATDDVDNSVSITVNATQVDLTEAGTYDIIYVATDSSGNSTSVTAQVEVSDVTEPTITGVPEGGFTMGIGGTEPDYTTGIAVTDDVDTDITFEVDSSAVDIGTIGTYEIVFTATDSVGNVATVTSSLEVTEVWV